LVLVFMNTCVLGPPVVLVFVNTQLVVGRFGAKATHGGLTPRGKL
jgi:hypothetical protein